MNSINLVALGDIMLGEIIGNNGRGVDSYLKQNGYSKAFIYIEHYLKESDILFGNIEAVIAQSSKSENPYSNSIIANINAVESLKAINLNVANIANNHSLDHGEKKFIKSYNLLKESGISIIGSTYGDSVSTIIERNGIKLNIIGFSLAVDKKHIESYYYLPKDINEIIQTINKYKNEVDHTVVSVHWGKEYINLPNFEQRKIAYKLIDSGASLLLGHHPHCYQGIEKYKNGLIVYSLGNCVFDDSYKVGKESIIFRCKFDKNSLLDYFTIPIRLNQFGIPFVPKDKNILDEKFKGIDNKLAKLEEENDSNYIKIFDKQFRNAYKKYRRHIKLNFITNLIRTNPKISYLLLKNFFLKKIK